MILSKTSQKKLLKFLKFKKLSFEEIWISNAVSIKGIDKETIESISKNEEVKEILLDKFIGEDPLENSIPIAFNSSSKADIIEPNMKWINADKAWAKGHKGKDIIIAFSDSGANYQHPGVVHSYLGKNGNTFDHNYHWFDPLFRSKTPIDTRDHGTHCMGSALGGKNVNRKIGVAPEAKWTHCHRTSTATVHKCLQWFLAPTNLEDKNPQVSKRPHITSHSYLCNGCGLDRATEALIQAGVHFVNAAGNSGPRCNSVVENAKMKDQITVAALSKGRDTVTSFSSKGQGPFSGLVKPEVAAPGENIISASGRGEAYVSKSGTSMAFIHYLFNN
jgi:subtilisin family serine protease